MQRRAHGSGGRACKLAKRCADLPGPSIPGAHTRGRSAHIPDHGRQRRELVIWGAHAGAGITTLDLTASPQPTELERTIAAARAALEDLNQRVGDPEVVVDERGWLPSERRELALDISRPGVPVRSASCANVSPPRRRS